MLELIGLSKKLFLKGATKLIRIKPKKLAQSLLQIHLQNEVKLSEILLLDCKESENYYNQIIFAHIPTNTMFAAIRNVGTQWDLRVVVE